LLPPAAISILRRHRSKLYITDKNQAHSKFHRSFRSVPIAHLQIS
jgi:hypothetical protein